MKEREGAVVYGVRNCLVFQMHIFIEGKTKLKAEQVLLNQLQITT